MADLRVTLPDKDVSWGVELLPTEAPEICAAVYDALPLETALVHGKFSGEEVYAPVEEEALLDLPKENLAHDVATGDVGYWYSHRDDGRFVRDRSEFGELVFVYGRRARLRMGADNPVAVDVIGQVSESVDAFTAAAARRQYEGTTRLRVERGASGLELPLE
ncbi:MAG: DUF3830 family protein [Haloferacaceae archaeon]